MGCRLQTQESLGKEADPDVRALVLGKAEKVEIRGRRTHSVMCRRDLSVGAGEADKGNVNARRDTHPGEGGTEHGSGQADSIFKATGKG